MGYCSKQTNYDANKRYLTAVTMVELLLALSVAAAITIASLRYYQVTHDAARVNRALTDFQTVMEAVYDYASVEPATELGNMNITTLTNRNYLPARFAGAQSALWSGTWGITPRAASGSYIITLTLNGLPSKPCASLAQKLTRASGITTTCTRGGGSYRVSLPIDLSEL